jgi:hypothetical protein
VQKRERIAPLNGFYQIRLLNERGEEVLQPGLSAMFPPLPTQTLVQTVEAREVLWTQASIRNTYAPQ